MQSLPINPSNKEILLISHVNPFTGLSGQSQRVYNTLMALGYVGFSIKLITTHKAFVEPEKFERLLKNCKEIEVEFLKLAIDKPNMLQKVRRYLMNQLFDLDPAIPISEKLGTTPKVRMLEKLKQIIAN